MAEMFRRGAVWGAAAGSGFWLGLLVASNGYDLAVRLRRRGI